MSALDEVKGSFRFLSFLAGMLGNLIRSEIKRGTLLETFRLTRENRTITLAQATLLGDLQEQKAQENGDRIYLKYEEQRFTYREMDRNSNRVAHGLLGCGMKSGEGVAIMMRNCPQFIDAFYATQKTGMYAVPVNVSLKGDGLVHILKNSEARAIVIDDASWDSYAAIKEQVPEIETIIVDRSEAPSSFQLPKGCIDLASFYRPEAPTGRPSPRPTRGAMSVLMYTSGTTGLPKGVVWKYGDSRVDVLGLLAQRIFNADDNLFTVAPLFHANALFVSGLSAMHANAKFSLGSRFSARSFWDEARRYGATSFNALGSIMEILMTKKPSPQDKDHRVRVIVSAAVTPDTWKRFEERYGLTVWQAYGAVDAGSGMLINFENSPKGSLGKPLGVKCRVINEEGEIAADGELGELQMYLGTSRPVEYFKDESATEAKVVDGWVRTGDMVTRDSRGNFYFMGRDIEHMRVRGENITCLDVEKEIMKHPAVEEGAVYGVPSKMGEDEVMAAIVLQEGQSISPEDLIAFLEDKLASFQMPRYIRFMDELPKTEIFKVKKKELQSQGVTTDTWDGKKEI
jgi:crotonobetaine/carnitine-CoA ligase